MYNKYIFTELTKTINGIVLHQIKRIADNVIGGGIEKEENLSQIGDAWVYGNAQVKKNSSMYKCC